MINNPNFPSACSLLRDPYIYTGALVATFRIILRVPRHKVSSQSRRNQIPWNSVACTYLLSEPVQCSRDCQFSWTRRAGRPLQGKFPPQNWKLLCLSQYFDTVLSKCLKPVETVVGVTGLTRPARLIGNGCQLLFSARSTAGQHRHAAQLRNAAAKQSALLAATSCPEFLQSDGRREVSGAVWVCSLDTGARWSCSSRTGNCC